MGFDWMIAHSMVIPCGTLLLEQGLLLSFYNFLYICQHARLPSNKISLEDDPSEA
jgi:hypothetical protein